MVAKYTWGGEWPSFWGAGRISSATAPAHSPNPGGAAYGVCVQNRSSDVYIANNEFDHLRHAVVLKEGANHCVIAYNWSHNWAILDPAVVDDEGNPIEAEADMSIHGFYSHNNLFEGNLCYNIFFADYWGPTGPRTVCFRNRCIAGDTLNGIFVDDYSHHESLVGNVIGRNGNVWVHQSCEDVMLEGNVLEGTVQWNTFSPDTKLPTSLYLASDEKPAFWPEEECFPPFGPDSPQSSSNVVPAAKGATAVEYNPHPRVIKSTARGTGVSGFLAPAVFTLHGRLAPAFAAPFHGSTVLPPARGLYIFRNQLSTSGGMAIERRARR